MKNSGVLVLFIGFIGVVASLMMVTSVSTSIGDVNNIGLMSDRQNYIIISGIIVVIGVIMMAVQSKTSPMQDASITDEISKPSKVCPECTEAIMPDAKQCRNCGNRDFSER